MTDDLTRTGGGNITTGNHWSVMRTLESPPRWSWSVAGAKGGESGVENNEADANAKAQEAYRRLQ